ncbi:transcriptional repressor NrdR [candidate division KSB1 bacterium]|nr:MAG: transcriptional repressor NrdR [candidate division KSB1 bacterium]
MKCPFCGNDEDRVIDSRPAREGKAIRRRRECSVCGSRFTTYEAPEEQVVLVIKSDGTREPFNRKKVYRGITIACNKRPVTADQAEQITAAVESRVIAADREVTTQQIGQWTLEELIRVDEVAYIRFASVFKRYENLNEFLKELNRIHSITGSSAEPV